MAGGLAALALIAFLVRLIGPLRGAGTLGILGHDDAVYFSAAVAFVEGRLPYRDFNMLHPPGIVYLLSPFALLGGVTGDATAFAVARLAFMVLGAVNAVLVALVGRSAGRTAAICAGLVYAVWVVPASWERTPYLVGPQATLLLIALLQLTGRDPQQLTLRRVALAGACIGAAGAIQVWTVIPAAVVFGWLVIVLRKVPRTLARLAAAYVAAGTLTALALLLPFLVTTGQRMINLIIFAQLGRTGGIATSRMTRLRFLEGVPEGGRIASLVPDVAVIAVFLAAAVVIAIVAWKRPETRLWAAILAAQTVFLMNTPVFFGHYGGWTAPMAALCIGATADTVFAWFGTRRRIAIGAFALAVVALLYGGVYPDGKRVPVAADDPQVRAARCVTADEVIVLITTESLRRDLRGGCEFLPNPSGLVHVLNVNRPGGKRSRPTNPEYQTAMERYYGASDAALFLRLNHAQLTDDTMAKIREHLPIKRQVGRVTMLLRQEP